jgi:hypothetical protein
VALVHARMSIIAMRVSAGGNFKSVLSAPQMAERRIAECTKHHLMMPCVLSCL